MKDLFTLAGIAMALGITLIALCIAALCTGCNTTSVICTDTWSYQKNGAQAVELRVGTYFTITPKGKVLARRTASGEWVPAKGYRMIGDTISHTDTVAAHKYYNTTK